MNSAVCGRRLARPVRLTLAVELGADLDGAWWPRTASVVRELPELIAGCATRLGEILDISVNWSSFEAVADLDSLNLARTIDPDQVIRHQRLMMITGTQASANLLVVPCRTSGVLALLVLRLAAAQQATAGEQDSQSFRAASDIVRAARAESALCARRLRDAGPARPTDSPAPQANSAPKTAPVVPVPAGDDGAAMAGFAPAATRIPRRSAE